MKIFKSFSFNKFFFNLFLISIFFIRLPSFYIIPFFQNIFLTSQSISRIFLVFIFFYIFFSRKIKIHKKDRLFFYLFNIFFIIQSLSVFYSINIFSFLARYKDVFISFLSFYIFYYFKDKKDQIIKVFLIAIFLNLFYQIIFILGFYDFLRIFIYDKHFNLAYEKFISQEKLYTDTYDEIFISFLFLNLFFKNNINLFFSFLILFFSFISNIRSRFLMAVFNIFVSFLIFFKNKDFIKKIFFIVFFIFVLLFNFYQSKSIIQRFFLEDELSDVEPVNFRKQQIIKSFEIGKKTIFGVGLGNYFDILENTEKYGKYLLGRFSLLSLGSVEYVHNIFGLILSEVGFIGLIIFLFIFILFIKKDIKILKDKENIIDKCLIISFWSLFVYGLFNPIVPLSYQFLFWGLRALL